MSVESTLDFVIHLWQNALSFVTPYYEKVEHVVEKNNDVLKSSVSNWHNSVREFIESFYLFNLVTLIFSKINETRKTVVNRVFNVIYDNTNEDNDNDKENVNLIRGFLKSTKQKVINYINYFRDFVLSIILFPINFVSSKIQFVFEQKEKAKEVIGKLNERRVEYLKSFQLALKFIRETKENFDFYEMIYVVLDRLQQISISLSKQKNKNILSRVLVQYDVTGLLQKAKARVQTVETEKLE